MSAKTAPTQDATDLQTPQESRNHFRAVIIFPIVTLVAAVIGYVWAGPVSEGAFMTNWLLGVIMFGMGLTVRPADFVLVVKKPVPVLLTVVAQYAIMPLAALSVVWVLGLPTEIAVGVILLGCVPGGTTSNVVTYLARGDVALSVTLTSVSTMLAPLVTPLLTLWLAGQYMPLDAMGMAQSILQIVLLPVLGGLVIRLLLPRLVEKLLPLLPWVSITAIAIVVAFVVSGSADRIVEAGLIVLAAVILHNILGMALGYGAAAATRQSPVRRRTVAIEVGMQNSALAAGLAAQYMNPLAALPGAVFSVWMMVSAAIFATWCRAQDRIRAAKDAKKVGVDD
ncbi:bile acid:sodium symporter family protein [Nesterenkonia alkaliphila]|uniref:Bile acid:sodium symporter family protein n=1 Tax=Nesterenkonia alkaliphila TaxID=1463631 RepID=A0A7K1UHZ4_9MICC|nr:bile acid:sodium symporter family protein [Nesterenkonia alkaliphila]MVT26088.1 bile acid:sodium symporter family protein [Nesterenkonia alkaliphila]GFZ79336.1 Na+-dependent transporter [Nesterenkonia alkaliphila]